MFKWEVTDIATKEAPGTLKSESSFEAVVESQRLIEFSWFFATRGIKGDSSCYTDIPANPLKSHFVNVRSPGMTSPHSHSSGDISLKSDRLLFITVTLSEVIDLSIVDRRSLTISCLSPMRLVLYYVETHVQPTLPRVGCITRFSQTSTPPPNLFGLFLSPGGKIVLAVAVYSEPFVCHTVKAAREDCFYCVNRVLPKATASPTSIPISLQYYVVDCRYQSRPTPWEAKN